MGNKWTIWLTAAGIPIGWEQERLMQIDKKDFLKLAGIGCGVSVSGLGNLGHSASAAES